MKWMFSNLAMSAFLALAAFVQKNDPDAKLWIFLYGVPSLLCLSTVLYSCILGNYHMRVLVQAHLCLCTAVACYSFKNLMDSSGSEGDLQWYKREVARELGGMAFVIVWLELLLLYDKGTTDRRERISLASVFLVSTPVVLWVAASMNKDYQETLPQHCKTAL